MSPPAGAGFAFGNVPAVHENFSLVVLGIVLVSLLPIAWEMYAAKKAAAAAAAAAKREQIPHSTPASAAAAVESAGLPPRIFPAAVAAAAEAVDIAKAKVSDPLEEERQDVYCKENPGADECKVYDD
jgi:predicted negative regulator of RcsB-dependent stress response